ncbi:hypothetical protein nbrc107696_23100 [Gordonia spumicola]|uniref:Toxin HicA n=1 Tax=Gordonia spumicola TaxID=589161 RepID=A0A7I9V9F0_9ACTN|nr:hypothetical protein nbrc107696_23100 [Gordonia spumicola]
MIRKIARAAAREGLDWRLDREGGKHSIYKLDGLSIPIGRHKGEIGARYAEMIYRECEVKLGKGWWR